MLGRGRGTGAGQELFDLTDDRFAVSDIREVVVPGQLDVPGTGNALGHEPARRDLDCSISDAVQYERRQMHRVEHGYDIDRQIGAVESDSRGGAQRRAAVARSPVA